LSSALHQLAFCILEQGLKPLPLRVVLTSSEPLLLSQRAAIEQAFQCPVRETYGMSEKAAAASECEYGRLHLWPDVAVYEVVNGDRPAAPGETGELLCTSLINPAMPLIRYRVGDLVRLAAESERCACGRTLPLLEEVVGRSGDVLQGANGRMIPPSSMEAVFDTNLRIREGQIIQEAIDRIRVRYVPAANCDHQDLGLLESRIVERMGPVRVTFEEMDGIPRGNNGKFQAVRRQMDVA
jgi:phenylacetate-CoA ligase